MMVGFAANAQVRSKAKAPKAKTQTTAKAQFTKGQDLVCIQDNVVLRARPSATAPAAEFHSGTSYAAAAPKISKKGKDENSDDLWITYLGKKENGYLYVHVFYTQDIFEEEIDGWIPEKYVKAACTKCEGHGVDYESFDDDNYSFKTCSMCRGRGY